MQHQPSLITVNEFIDSANCYSILWLTTKFPPAPNESVLSEQKVLVTSVTRDRLGLPSLTFDRLNTSAINIPIDNNMQIVSMSNNSLFRACINYKQQTLYEIEGVELKPISATPKPDKVRTIHSLQDVLIFDNPAYFDAKLSYKTNLSEVDVISLHTMNLTMLEVARMFRYINLYLDGYKEMYNEARTICFVKAIGNDGVVKSIDVGLYGLESKRIFSTRRIKQHIDMR